VEQLIHIMKKLLLFSLLLFLISACSDPCDDVICQNGAVCDEGTCLCEEGYEGTLCESELRTKYLGTYSGFTTCVDPTGEEEPQVIPTTLQIGAGPSILDLTVSEDGSDPTVITLVNGNTFNLLVVDSFFGDPISINQDGVFEGDKLTIQMTTTLLGQVGMCTIDLIKE